MLQAVDWAASLRFFGILEKSGNFWVRRASACHEAERFAADGQCFGSFRPLQKSVLPRPTREFVGSCHVIRAKIFSMNVPEDLAQSQSASEQQLGELLSAEFDDELSASERQTLEQLRRQYPDAADRFTAQFERVRSVMGGPPVSAQQAALVSAKQVALLGRARKPVTRNAVLQGRAWKVSVTIAAAAMLFALVNQFRASSISNPLADATPVKSSLESAMSDVVAIDEELQLKAVMDSTPGANSAAGGTEAFAADQGAEMAPAISGFGGTGDPGVGAAVAGAAAAPRELPTQVRQTSAGAKPLAAGDSAAELQILASSKEWTVVVVRIPQAAPAVVMSGVDRVLERYGLQRQREDVAAESDWLGVVVGGSEESQRKLVADVEEELKGEDAEWDPARVFHSSRDEILAAVRKTLQTPTEAELERGEVFVTVEKSSALRSLAVDEQVSDGASQSAALAIADAASDSPVDQEGASTGVARAKSAAASPKARGSRPLLLVLSLQAQPVNG